MFNVKAAIVFANSILYIHHSFETLNRDQRVYNLTKNKYTIVNSSQISHHQILGENLCCVVFTMDRNKEWLKTDIV